MGKISKLYINGKLVEIDDKDAVQLPDEYQDGDTLVYNEETNSFVAKSTNEAIELQNQLNNQEKPVSSKTVKNAIDNINSVFRGGILNFSSEITLEYDYKAATHEVRARAFNPSYGGYAFSLGGKLDIAVFCLDADYDSDSEIYYIGSFLGILTIDNSKFYGSDEWDEYSSDYRGHFSGTLVIPDSVKTRVLNFIVIDPITKESIVRRSVYNNIIVPSATAKTITVSSSDLNLYESQLIFTLSEAIPAASSIDLKVTICGGRDKDFTEVKTLTLNPGQASFTLNIGESGFSRNIYVEIIDSHDNDYTLVNANSVVSGRIPNKLLILTFISRHLLCQVLNNRGLSIVSGSTLYTDLNPATDGSINLDTDNKLEVVSVNDIGSEPDIMRMPMDGAGYTRAALAEEIDVSESDIPLLGQNIHNKNVYAQIAKLFVTHLMYNNPDYNANDIKYIILNHQQFELWIRDENGYLVSAYTHPVKYNINN